MGKERGLTRVACLVRLSQFLLIFSDLRHWLRVDGTSVVLTFQVGQRAIHQWTLQQLVPAQLEYLVEVAGVLYALL